MTHHLPKVRRSRFAAVFAYAALLLLVGLGPAAAVAHAQQGAPQLQPTDSAWARFPVGSWRREETTQFRQNAETGLMELGEVSRRTETLIAIQENHYVLQVVVDLVQGAASKELASQTEKHYFDDSHMKSGTRHAAETTTAIHPETGQEISVRKFLSVVDDESIRSEMTSLYAEFQDPLQENVRYSQLIQRHFATTLKTGEHSTTTDVVWELTNAGQAVLGYPGITWVNHATQIQTNPMAGSVKTQQVLSPFVPGGTLSVNTNEYSASGEFTKGSETKLLEFGLEPREEKQDGTTVPDDGKESASANNEQVGSGEEIDPDNATFSNLQPADWVQPYAARRVFPARSNRRMTRRQQRNWRLAQSESPVKPSPAETMDFPGQAPDVACSECQTNLGPATYHRPKRGLLARLFAPRHRQRGQFACPSCGTVTETIPARAQFPPSDPEFPFED